MPARRFPPPWSIEDNGNCFIVTDSAGQKLAYVYYEEERGRRSAEKLHMSISRNASNDTVPRKRSRPSI